MPFCLFGGQWTGSLVEASCGWSSRRGSATRREGEVLSTDAESHDSGLQEVNGHQLHAEQCDEETFSFLIIIKQVWEDVQNSVHVYIHN